MRLSRRGGGLVLTAAALIAAILAIVVKTTVDDDSADHDAAIVFCFGSAQRSGLGSAAIALGLASPARVAGDVVVAGRVMTLQEWRKDRPADFTRACSALEAASSQAQPTGAGAGPADRFLAVLVVLLPVAAGAGLTWTAGEYRAAAERTSIRADAVAAAMESFAGAVSAYISAWTQPGAEGFPADTELQASRNELVSRLRAAEQAQRSGAVPLAEIRRQIEDGALGQRMRASLAEMVPRQQGSEPASTPQAEQLRQSLDELQDDVNKALVEYQRVTLWRRGSIHKVRTPVTAPTVAGSGTSTSPPAGVARR